MTYLCDLLLRLIQMEIRVLVVLTRRPENARFALDRECAQNILLITEQAADFDQSSGRCIESGGHISRLPEMTGAVHHGELSGGFKSGGPTVKAQLRVNKNFAITHLRVRSGRGLIPWFSTPL